MSRGMRTLLRTLTNKTDDHPTTFVVPAEPSLPPRHRPPRVQPHFLSSSSFHGRDQFTSDELIQHRLGRSKRNILRNQIEPDPEYPDISYYAGDWKAATPPFDWDWDCDKASLCNNWRHKIENPLEAENLEVQKRRDRIEKRLISSLEPEFTRAVDKEDFRRRMFVQFGWTQDGEETPVLQAMVDEQSHMAPIPGTMEDLAEGDRERERHVTQLPSVLLPPAPETSAHGGAGSNDTTASFPCIGDSQLHHKQPHLPHSKHYEAIKKDKELTLRERYYDDGASRALERSHALPRPNSFEDKAYPTPNLSSSSVYSVHRNSACSWHGRISSPELFMRREDEPSGPSLITPFSWSEVPPSSSTQPLVPPLPLSQRSFLSISKDMPIHVVLRKVLPRAVTIHQLEQPGRTDVGRFDRFEKMPTVAVGIESEEPTLRDQLRASKTRSEKAEWEETEKEDALNARKVVGGWFSRFSAKVYAIYTAVPIIERSRGIYHTNRGLPISGSLLGSRPEYHAMDDASKGDANLHASAAALHVILQIHDTKHPDWTSARFVLREDKRNLLRAEIFITAITSAFTALIKGGKFPNSRTSLNNNNAIIKAAGDAAHDKVAEIKNRNAERRIIEEANKSSLRAAKGDETYNPNQKAKRTQTDGANSNCTNSDLSIKSHQNSDDDHDANYHLAPNPPIQRHNYKFWPPLRENINSTSSNAAQTAAALVARPLEAVVATKPKKPMSAADIPNVYIYKPLFPNTDPRHPSVIEHERKTGIKNVIGTGLNGRLTKWDIMDAATNVENLPEGLKTMFMSADEKVEYEKTKEREAKAAAKAAREEARAAEANKREKLKIAAGGNDSEQENPFRESKSQPSKSPHFDPQSRVFGSDDTISCPENARRKSKNRSVVPDSEATAPSPRRNDFDIFDDTSTPLNFKYRRARRHSSSGSVISVVKKENGSPAASVPPHQLRLYSKRFTLPAPPINAIAKRLARPAIAKRPIPCQGVREKSESTEELTQPRSPRPIRAPRPNIKSKPSTQGLRPLRKVQSNTGCGSLDAPSDDSALLKPSSTSAASRKRRRESTASQEQERSPYFQKQPKLKRGQQAKLHQLVMPVRSESPAVSVVSTTASERPTRTKKPALRQSLPAYHAKRISADEFLITKPSTSSKSASAQRTKVPPRSSETGVIGTKVRDEEMINKPVKVTDKEYHVEAIIGLKIHDGRTYYRVKWQDYPEDKNTWEPASNLSNAHRILNEYRSSLHDDSTVESIITHRSASETVNHRTVNYMEYLVKWQGFSKEYSSWETEEAIRSKDGVKEVLYYRIRHNVGFGRGSWMKRKEAVARQLLREAGLEPELGGRIKVEDMGVKDEDDDRDELPISARGVDL